MDPGHAPSSLKSYTVYLSLTPTSSIHHHKSLFFIVTIIIPPSALSENAAAAGAGTAADLYHGKKSGRTKV
jgi:hypothetical protein